MQLIGSIPTWLSDTAAFIGASTVIIGGVTAVLAFAFRLRPVKWLGRQLQTGLRVAFFQPAADLFDAQVREASEELASRVEGVGQQVEELYEAIEDHRHYVLYHLGPNGKTKPIHQRLQDLERVHRIDVDLEVEASIPSSSPSSPSSPNKEIKP